MSTSGARGDLIGAPRDISVLIGQLLSATEAAASGIRAINEETKASNHTITVAVTTLETVANAVAELNRLVRDGNGQPSMSHRLTVLEVKGKTLGEDIVSLKNDFNSLVTAKVISRGQVIAGVVGMVFTAVMSLGAILAQLMR